jgi:hypothetical protein
MYLMNTSKTTGRLLLKNSFLIMYGTLKTDEVMVQRTIEFQLLLLTGLDSKED